MDLNEVPRRLAAALRARRDELGLTQEAAAEKCAVSTRYWRDLEAGSSSVSLDVMDKILHGLGWAWGDVPAILGRRVATPTAPASTHELLDRAWARLSPAERNAFAGVMRALVRIHGPRR